MSPIVVNLEGVKTTLEAIPQGTYPGRFTAFKAGMSKANQPKITLEGVFNEDAGEAAAGRKWFVECSLQKQALFKIKKAMIDMGADPDDLEVNGLDIEPILEDLKGGDVVIKVGTHEWQGEERNDFYIVPQDSWSN